MNEKREKALIEEINDPLVHWLSKLIVFSVKFLAVLMAFVVIWSLVDVVVHVYRQFMESWNTAFNSESIFPILGAFLVVLIAIEIFLNIVFYLKKDHVDVSLVLATALTAVARKVIILDYSNTAPLHLFGTGVVILAVGIVMWLLTKKS